MAQSLRRVVAGGGSVSELSDEEESSEERIAHIMRKIGFVAACIDLDRWRHVIDQVLREVEADNRLQGDRVALRH